MADKRFIVRLSSDGDSELYYNAENAAGAPAFQSSKFSAEADAACIAKAKKGTVYALEPKAVKPPPKPYNFFPIYMAILIGVIFVFRYPTLFGFVVPESQSKNICAAPAHPLSSAYAVQNCFIEPTEWDYCC